MSTNFDNVEFFHNSDYAEWVDDEGNPLESGFYYWFCFPGCLPDSEPIGPFNSIEHAQASFEDENTSFDEEQDSLYDDDSGE